MFQGFQERGFAPTAADVATLTRRIGHGPGWYEDFVRDTDVTCAITPGRNTAESP
jgi:hypothetical protein